MTIFWWVWGWFGMGMRRTGGAMASRTVPEPLHTLLRVLTLRSPAKHLHSRRVADLAVGIGQHLGLPDTALARLWWGALLHDLGVVGIPDAIVNKPGSLTDAEWAVMRQHAPLGASLVSLSAFTPDVLAVARILRSHHERWDGSGYPDGLAGSHIPLVVRIIAVADVLKTIPPNHSEQLTNIDFSGTLAL
jgi:putative two-component system response regulator